MSDNSMSDVIPIEALFDESGTGPNLRADPRHALNDAEVVIGVDVMTQREHLIYGRELLQQIAGGKLSRSGKVIRIGIDDETEELEKLAASCR